MMDSKQLISNKEQKSLICVLGWEDRFLQGISYDILQYDINCILLVIYSDYFEKDGFKDVMQNNLSILEEECEKKSISIELIFQHYSDAIINYSNIHLLETSILKLDVKNILIDITTIPREMIWNILTFTSLHLDTIELIYHKPQNYDSWLCRNFDKPLLQIGHSGISQFGKQTALVVITGFEVERTRQLINHYEPDIVCLCIQTGEQFENAKRNIESHQGFCTPNLIKYFELDSYDIETATSALNTIVEDLENYNIILSSQGPKTSSIVVYNVFKKFPNIGLSYVPSKDINIAYSSGIADKISYSFK